MSPREVLATHTARELTEWKAYWRIVEHEQEQARQNQQTRPRGRR